ncbi:hypothetical protein OHW62_10350 [Acinetobacter baumannii]|nr:hypothetical protein [Acinetobacter baumannii]
MEQFLKRISFFLVYLPALVYACQFAYYSGLCEPLNISISSLGMNYTEVMFLGYLNISVDLLENFGKLAMYAYGLIAYLVIAFLLHWIAVHPSERNNEKQRLRSLFYRILYEIPKIKFSLIKSLNGFSGLLFLYFFIFIITILLIFSFYKKGEKQIIESLSEMSEINTGYILQKDKKVKVQPILCGNYKCYGIALKNREAITYLPEQYIQPIDDLKKNKTL